MGEIGSSGRVREFRDRWIREKRGIRDASSMWEGVGVCRWREIRPVLFRKVLLFWVRELMRSFIRRAAFSWAAIASFRASERRERCFSNSGRKVCPIFG